MRKPQVWIGLLVTVLAGSLAGYARGQAGHAAAAGTSFYRMEAEAMTLIGGVSVISDPTASGGYAVKAWTNFSGVGGSATFSTSGTYAFAFGGREDYYAGTDGAHAHVSLYLDGASTPAGGVYVTKSPQPACWRPRRCGATRPAGGVYVTNTSGYLPYTITVPLSAGTHSFQLLFDNDAFGGSSSEDRNAYIDYVTIAAATDPPVTTPVPAQSTPLPVQSTATSTPLPVQSTATSTPLPAQNTATSTATGTPVPATSTATGTPLLAQSTATSTAAPAHNTATSTATSTAAPAHNTATSTATSTAAPAQNTATSTAVPAQNTATSTAVPAQNTATSTAVPASSTATPTDPAVTSTPVPPTDTATPSSGHAIKTVFLIVMENENWSSIQGSSSAPYINNNLLPMASYATQYDNPPGNHPSLPNYLWLEGGQCYNYCGTDNGASQSPNGISATQHLTTLLNSAGISWKAYEENITDGTCPVSDNYPYAVRHNPFVYFNDVNGNSSYCTAHERSYADLATDLANNSVARYNFITPNLCDDGHDSCAPLNDPVKQTDTWLSTQVPMILNSQAYKNGGALFITWDEGEGSDGPIGMIVLSPYARGHGYSNTLHYTHSSMLRTLEEIFGVSPLLGDAANATDLRDLFTTFP